MGCLTCKWSSMKKNASIQILVIDLAEDGWIIIIQGYGCGLHLGGVAVTRPLSEGPVQGCDVGELQQSGISRYQGTKPDSVFKLEQGETPWIAEGAIYSWTSPEEIRAINHMQWHPENRNKLKSLERSLQSFALEINFGLNKNLVPLTQEHNMFDSHYGSLQSHLNFVIQNRRDAGRDSDEFSGFEKSSVHVKHDKTFPGIKYRGYFKPSSTKSQLNDHPKTYTEEQPHKCSECGKVLYRKSLLLYHQRIHTGEKPCVCGECGKAFFWKSLFKRHQWSHTGEKVYGCNECGKSFSEKAYLVLLQRLYTGVKPYECSECGRTFAFKSALTKHQRIHTGERPYECSECEKAFRSKPDLIQHQRTHSRERLYGCSERGKDFTHMSFLVKHKEIHAREKVINLLKVRKSSLGRHSSLYMYKLIQEQNHMNTVPLEMPSSGTQSLNICELQGGSGL
ncbi:zinc finger protein 577-like isoform X2 [Loxodonta africana]|uniref:zinc finger protein 577-like isoform X2 n=1 Tax=Loxodonta africana TaxID=9785 RepID=UPI0030CE97B0